MLKLNITAVDKMVKCKSGNYHCKK